MQRVRTTLLAQYLRSSLSLSTQQTRSLVIVDVKNNNVDFAVGKVQRECKENGLIDELRKREYHRSGSDLKMASHRKGYNQRMGYIIQERLRWMAKRSK
jgi:ribosomal protein S21